MLVIAIDIGSYSVKTVTTRVERKKVSYVSHQEIKIEHYEKYDPGLTLRENQHLIVKDIIEIVPANAKIVMTAEEDLVTTRFITIPVKNRKKAELMIPFQIDDEIPYSISEAHLVNSIRVDKDSSYAIVNIFKRDQFEQYLEEIKIKTDLPDVLTTPTVAIANMAEEEFSDNNFCILDMGHSRIRAYFFNQGNLTSFYTCFHGGKDIDLEISNRYNIKTEEAQVYKHQNCFILTESQKEMADKKQRDFSILMEGILSRFISDLRRWELGHRVSTGSKVAHIYITGGTSNIKGLDQYITEQMQISTERFPKLHSVIIKKKVDEQFYSKFVIATLLAANYKNKSLMANALSNEFSVTGSDEIPLNTMAFVGIRSLMITAVFILSLTIEGYLASKEEKKLKQSVQSALRNNRFIKLTASEKAQIARKPEIIIKKIEKLNRTLKKEVQMIKSSANINAIYPLAYLMKNLGKTAATMTTYSSIDGSMMNVVFKAKKIEILNKLKSDLLSALDGKDPVVQINEEKKELSLEASI